MIFIIWLQNAHSVKNRVIYNTKILYITHKYELLLSFSLNRSLVADIYVGEDGKLHKVQGGADSVLPFSSGGDYLKIAVGKASVDSGGSTTITIPEAFTCARIFYIKYGNTSVYGLYQYEDGTLTAIKGNSYVSVSVRGRTITCTQSLTDGVVFGCLYE